MFAGVLGGTRSPMVLWDGGTFGAFLSDCLCDLKSIPRACPPSPVTCTPSSQSTLVEEKL